MGYQLGIDVPFSQPHPAFPFETLAKARFAANDAIERGYIDIEDQGISIFTGPGTIYKVISDEYRKADEPPLAAFNFVLIIGVIGGQFPLGYNKEADMLAAIAKLKVRESVQHCGKEGHEYTYIEHAPWLFTMKMTKSQFLDHQHRLAVAMQQQKAVDDAKVSRILPAR